MSEYVKDCVPKQVRVQAVQVTDHMSHGTIAGFLLGNGYSDFRVHGTRRPFGVLIGGKSEQFVGLAQFGDWIVIEKRLNDPVEKRILIMDNHEFAITYSVIDDSMKVTR